MRQRKELTFFAAMRKLVLLRLSPSKQSQPIEEIVTHAATLLGKRLDNLIHLFEDNVKHLIKYLQTNDLSVACNLAPGEKP